MIGLAYYGTERHLNVGYRPTQPIEFSHKVHAGDMATDCRYCHYTAESAAFAAVPPTQICFNCHSKVLTNSPKLVRALASLVKGNGIAWVRVHKLAEHVHFDHGAHLAVGVGCATCHGRVDQMDVVQQTEPLSMGWCLDCHRNPGPFIRSAGELTHRNLDSRTGPPPARELAPPIHCTGCHR